MKNRYFSIIDKMRLKKEPNDIIEKEYNEVLSFIRNTSPSYNELIEICRFIKILESSFLYPNKKNTLYYKNESDALKCPIVVSLGPVIEMDINGGILYGVDQSRYNIRINLFRDEYIEILITDSDNPKKPISRVKFKDGECIVNEEIYENHLYITILDSLSKGVEELLKVYCNKFERNSSKNNEPINKGKEEKTEDEEKKDKDSEKPPMINSTYEHKQSFFEKFKALFK